MASRAGRDTDAVRHTDEEMAVNSRPAVNRQGEVIDD